MSFVLQITKSWWGSGHDDLDETQATLWKKEKKKTKVSQEEVKIPHAKHY